MIEAKLLRDEGILVICPLGALRPADFDQIRTLAGPYIEEHGELSGVLIDAESFPGWEDFSAMLSHLRFVEDFQHKVRRVAAVTDNGFLAILPKVADWFVAAEVRHFAYQDRDQALAWLKRDEPPPAV